MNKEAQIIVEQFCEVLNVSVADVLSPSQKREHCDARFLIVSQIKKTLDGHFPLATIGKWFSKSEKSAHCFVLYCEKQTERLKVNKVFNQKYLKCKATIFDSSIYDNVPQY